jgi:excisionase family DNA binding protein
VPAQVAFVRVKEAAELLGVSPNTIRAWGAAGKIAEHRHPVNNYRLFKVKELQAIVAKMNAPARPKKPR